MPSQLSSIATGGSISYCYPADRLYPTTQFALDCAAACNATSLLLYPAQAIELCEVVRNNPHYEKIVRSLSTIQWCGAGMDTLSSESLESLKVPTIFINIHGLSELGFSGMTTMSAPFNGLQNTGSYALWEPVEDHNSNEGNESSSRLVKLWIAVDKHPIAWHMIALNYSPINMQRYPGPGPMKNRPAIDTGDLFEERMLRSGEIRYFHHSRDDDLIRLSNLYRPDASDLESRLSSFLTKKGRLPMGVIDAIQILGDKKAKLAVVVQIHGSQLRNISRDKAGEAICLAFTQFDKTIPNHVAFNGLDRVKVIIKDDQVQDDSQCLLEKTHKGNLKRRLNTIRFSPWLDSLDVTDNALGMVSMGDIP